MPLLPASWYYPVHLICVSILSLYASFILSNCDNNRLIAQKKSLNVVYIYAILFIIIVGLRPIGAKEFGDSGTYAAVYGAFQRGWLDSSDGLGGDWLWNSFMFYCSSFLPINLFFLLVEFLYVFPLIVACKRWSYCNSSLLLLFALGAFSFFSYGTNGLRNGMACSFAVLALTYIGGSKKDKLIWAFLCFLAIFNHKSTSLPIIAMLFTYLYPKPKPMFFFWIGSILISIIAGSTVSSFFESLGFDERMTTYLDTSDSELFESFSHSGFRWDFLLYSFMPILLGWYVLFRRKAEIKLDYMLLLGTYIYSNSFWVMVIRAAYSNRFAYLSWFLYPFVLAYPLLELNIVPNQGRRLSAIIMILHLGFTLIMFLR